MNEMTQNEFFKKLGTTKLADYFDRRVKVFLELMPEGLEFHTGVLNHGGVLVPETTDGYMLFKYQIVTSDGIKKSYLSLKPDFSLARPTPFKEAIINPVAPVIRLIADHASLLTRMMGHAQNAETDIAHEVRNRIVQASRLLEDSKHRNFDKDNYFFDLLFFAKRLGFLKIHESENFDFDLKLKQKSQIHDLLRFLVIADLLKGHLNYLDNFSLVQDKSTEDDSEAIDEIMSGFLGYRLDTLSDRDFKVISEIMPDMRISVDKWFGSQTDKILKKAYDKVNFS